MSEHVPAHRLAALQAGELDEQEAYRVQAHLSHCALCQAAAGRVADARRGLAEVSRDSGPELAWNLIWPRIRWITSAHERTREGTRGRRSRRTASIAVGALAACAAVVAGVLMQGSPSISTDPVAVGIARPEPLELAAPPRPADPLVGVLTMVAGQVWIDSKAPSFDAPIGALAIIETGEDGRVAVQFGRDSAFAVGPDSSLRIRALDSGSVVLDIRGEISVEVSERAEGQQFAVIAGTRRVEVRGTAFRVENRGGALDVACGHGHVVVREGASAIDVRAGQVVSILEAIAGREATALDREKHAALEQSLRLPMVPSWTGGRDVLRTSGRLAVQAPGIRPVAIDGRRVGQGSLTIRVSPGRHHIDAEGVGEWVEVAAGNESKAVAVGPPRRSRQRNRQLESSLGHREVALRRCVARLDREGVLHGTSIELEIGINRDGSQAFLNILDTNLPTSAAHCLRDVVDGIRFPRGERATLRETLAF